MNLTDKVINVLGDSITEGAGASSEEYRFTNVLEREYQLKRVNNYGIGGTRIARQPIVTDDSMDQDFCLRVDTMDVNADAVVVFGGTNDYGHGEALLGSRHDRTPETFHGACHYLMNRLLTLYWGKPILIVTPLRRTGESNPLGDGTGRKTCPCGPLSIYRDIIVNTAAYYSLPVLDLYYTSGIQPENPVILRNLLPDGLHPNDAGHAIIARRIGEALKML